MYVLMYVLMFLFISFLLFVLRVRFFKIINMFVLTVVAFHHAAAIDAQSVCGT